MSTTYVGFSTPNWFNPVSWLVRKISGSKVSHTWFAYQDDDLDIAMVMEAHEIGFRIIPLQHFLKYNTVVAMFAPRRPLDEGLKTIAKKFLASRYDFGGLIGMAWVKLGLMLNRRWMNPFRNPKHVFCSEALALAMAASPAYWDFQEDAETVDPEDLMRFFTQDGSPLVSPYELIPE